MAYSLSTRGQDNTTTCYREPGYFQFPFPPYKIQEEFMKELYCVLEKGGVGIFESPTGTSIVTWDRKNLEADLLVYKNEIERKRITKSLGLKSIGMGKLQ